MAALGALAGCARPGSLSTDTFNLETVVTRIALTTLPPEFEGYRVAFASDLHFGPFVPHDYLREMTVRINDAKPDLVVLGGDYIGVPDRFPATAFSGVNEKFAKPKDARLTAAIYEDLALILRDIKAPAGTAAILGNHDHWNDERICAKHLNNAGVKILVNETLQLKRGNAVVNIFGVDDFWTGVPRPQRIMRGAATILVSHNPDFVERALALGQLQFDLALCGHTHGGQIRLPLVGAAAGYNVRSKRFRSGLTEAAEGPVYVTRGIGVVDIPVRINCRPELSIFELSRA